MKISFQFGSIRSSLTILRRVSVGTWEALIISASRKRCRREESVFDHAGKGKEGIVKVYKDR
jgi:hypothetical protein